MHTDKKIELLVQLGKDLQQDSTDLNKVLQLAHYDNLWFTLASMKKAIRAIVQNYLNEEKLREWLANYTLNTQNREPYTVGLVMAGNLPLVGLHDFLCVLFSGHRAQIKLSNKDKRLFTYIYYSLLELEPDLKQYIQIAPKLSDFDAVIATGSNNSARYFEHYFGKYPHIIRKNRSSVAVLTGKETPEQIKQLGIDIFRYFGLGCRNVSKVFVPVGYDLAFLLDNLKTYSNVMLHSKYKSNYDYNRSLLLMNQEEHLATEYLMLLKREAVSSPTAVLHYETYKNEYELANRLTEQEAEIQCIVGDPNFHSNCIPFGQAQNPQLWDYADKVDTMNFLIALPEKKYSDV